MYYELVQILGFTEDEVVVEHEGHEMFISVDEATLEFLQEETIEGHTFVPFDVENERLVQDFEEAEQIEEMEELAGVTDDLDTDYL